MLEGSLALWRKKWKTVISVCSARFLTGVLTGMILGVRRIAGETAAAPVHCSGNNFGVRASTRPRLAACMIYTYFPPPRGISLRGLASQSVGAGLVLRPLVLLSNIAARLILARGSTLER